MLIGQTGVLTDSNEKDYMEILFWNFWKQILQCLPCGYHVRHVLISTSSYIGNRTVWATKVWTIFWFADGYMKPLFVLNVGVRQTRFEKWAVCQYIKRISIAMQRKSQILMDHYILEALMMLYKFWRRDSIDITGPHLGLHSAKMIHNSFLSYYRLHRWGKWGSFD